MRTSPVPSFAYWRSTDMAFVFPYHFYPLAVCFVGNVFKCKRRNNNETMHTQKFVSNYKRKNHFIQMRFWYLVGALTRLLCMLFAVIVGVFVCLICIRIRLLHQLYSMCTSQTARNDACLMSCHFGNLRDAIIFRPIVNNFVRIFHSFSL